MPALVVPLSVRRGRGNSLNMSRDIVFDTRLSPGLVSSPGPRPDV